MKHRNLLFIFFMFILYTSVFASNTTLKPQYRSGYSTQDVEDVRENLRKESKENTEKEQKVIRSTIDKNINRILALKNIVDAIDYWYDYKEDKLDYGLYYEPWRDNLKGRQKDEIPWSERRVHYFISTDNDSIRLSNQDFFIRVYFKGGDEYHFIKSYIPEPDKLGNEITIFENMVYKRLDEIRSLVKGKIDSWVKVSEKEWYYKFDNRSKFMKGWYNEPLDNQRYFFDPDTGKMALGWTEIDGEQYYFEDSIKREQNWVYSKETDSWTCKRKEKSLGSLYRNEKTPDGKKVDKDGKLIK